RIEGSVEFEVPFAILRRGNGFKIFESNGEALNYGDIFRADSDAYIDNTGVWVVKATPLLFGNRLGSYTVSSFDG
ncbi:hypothetical protein MUP59_02765, partial [Candidatus Bathyarchaeota archaeon]|nr:hypothetical protein [Candidatus Bathyarchaeota archaeon]